MTKRPPRTSDRDAEVFGGERMAQGSAEGERDEGVVWGVEEPRRVEPEDPAVAKGADGKVRLGKCYVMAGRYAVDHAGATLVHGTVRVGQSKTADGRGVPIDHAWAEVGDVVYDGVQGQLYDRADYYEKMGAEAGRIYSREEAVAEMLRTEHFGPWRA